MNDARTAIYDGVVVHKRLRPVRHVFRYHVFSLLIDCAEIDALDRRLRFFSYNRFNLFSLHDRDHGDGSPIAAYLARIAAAGGHRDVKRFLMLGYPRVLGYVFNPVTIYFGLDGDERTRIMIYEVNNTFGERKTYVLPAEPDGDGAIEQSCRKRFYVSPFNPAEGRYRFHATPIGDALSVNIALADDNGPLMCGYFSGARIEIGDGALVRALLATGWMTVKVIAGIHFEALKLWLKGLRVVKRPPPPPPVTYVASPWES